MTVVRCSGDGGCEERCQSEGAWAGNEERRVKGQDLGEQTLALDPSTCLGGDALAFGGPTILFSVG